MAASAEPSPPPPEEASTRYRPEWRSPAGIALVAALGCGSGWLSWWAECRVEEIDSGSRAWAWMPEEFVFLPGLIYALLWLGVAWVPGLLLVRHRVRRSVPWSLLILMGIAASYAMAYHTALRVTIWLDARPWFPKEGPLGLAVGGILGGAVGGAGLVSLWSLLFPGAEDWAARSLLIGLGAALGSLLGTWDIDQGMVGLPILFPAWQGGMAAALASVDLWKRRRDAGG